MGGLQQTLYFFGEKKKTLSKKSLHNLAEKNTPPSLFVFEKKTMFSYDDRSLRGPAGKKNKIINPKIFVFQRRASRRREPNTAHVEYIILSGRQRKYKHITQISRRAARSKNTTTGGGKKIPPGGGREKKSSLSWRGGRRQRPFGTTG